MTLKIFISYAHKDEIYFKVFLDELEQIVGSSGQIKWKIWEDHQLKIGGLWHDQIQACIHEVDAAVLLVSPAFLSSNYIRDEEFEKILQRQKTGRFLIFPLLFLPCKFSNWEELRKRQLFIPEGGEYGCPNIKNLAYGHLVEFTKENQPIPNTMRYQYMLDFVDSVEEAVQAALPISAAHSEESHYPEIADVVQKDAIISLQSLALLPECYKYACNRIPQRDKFQTYQQQLISKKVLFFCVHGKEEQSPIGISKRFHYELTKQINDSLKPIRSFPGVYREIEFTDSLNERLFKLNLVNSLFANFNINPDNHAPTTESNLGVIFRNSPELLHLVSDNIVTIYIRIIRIDWRDFIPNILQWFINVFCHSDNLPETAPSFYFFISISYDDQIAEKKYKMLQNLTVVDGLLFLPELVEVQKMHITEWLRKHSAGRTTKHRKELFVKHFDEKDVYDMEDVEVGLEEIINEVNYMRLDRLN